MGSIAAICRKVADYREIVVSSVGEDTLLYSFISAKCVIIDVFQTRLNMLVQFFIFDDMVSYRNEIGKYFFR